MADEKRDSRQRFERLRRTSFKLDVERTRNQIGAAETALYVFVGLFLLIASFLILWDTVEGFVERASATVSRRSSSGSGCSTGSCSC